MTMRVLIVGALDGELGQAAQIARGRGAHLVQADGIEAALERLRQSGCDLLLCDVRYDIGALVAALGRERISAPVIACGANADAGAAVRAIRCGAQDFLPLPPDAEVIAAMLQAAARGHDALVGHDPAMRAALRRAEQIAASEATVLITGESGTGKEVFARHIHVRSRRAGGPFVALNCAAIPEQLLESELFGHEKGAFSGAVARRTGRFEQAAGGTLLLDEIGEMDIRLQAKLLRAIQEREVDRVGGAAPVKVDARILAATNRDLLALATAGRFRQDLYFRLNVVTLALPALRERPEDIPLLAQHFADKYAQLNGLPSRRVGEAAAAALAAYGWPGNIRELENTLHRAVLLANGPVIEPADLELPDAAGPDAQDAWAPPDAPRRPPPAAPRPPALMVGRTVEETERLLILDTLGHCLGNRTQAAAILGISIRTLRNKLRDYAASGVAVPRPTSGVAA